jgi:hypothetical protein
VSHDVHHVTTFVFTSCPPSLSHISLVSFDKNKAKRGKFFSLVAQMTKRPVYVVSAVPVAQIVNRVLNRMKKKRKRKYGPNIGIVTGLRTRDRLRIHVGGVRVRVGISQPPENPYPWHGFIRV